MDTNADDTIEENVSTTEEDTEEPVEPLEKPAPARKPRTQKQIAAFEKARAALAVKRANDKELKDQNKKPIGRPKKVAAAALVAIELGSRPGAPLAVRATSALLLRRHGVCVSWDTYPPLQPLQP